MSSKSSKTRYKLGDKVHIDKNRQGIIRFKGELDGKFNYGIELTVGKGKHNGTYNGKQYFQCVNDKGIFVTPKQILRVNDKVILQLNSIGNSPSQKPKNSKQRRNSLPIKSNEWQAPSWTNDVLINDGSAFLDDKQAHRGKLIDLKSLYGKAGYLPVGILRHYTHKDLKSWDKNKLIDHIKQLQNENTILKQESSSSPKQSNVSQEDHWLKKIKELEIRLEETQKCQSEYAKKLEEERHTNSKELYATKQKIDKLSLKLTETNKENKVLVSEVSKLTNSKQELIIVFKDQIDKLNKNNKNNIAHMSELHIQQMKSKQIEFGSTINNLKYKIEEIQSLKEENENKLNELKQQNVENEKEFNMKIAILTEQNKRLIEDKNDEMSNKLTEQIKLIDVLISEKNELNNELKNEKQKYKQLKQNEEIIKDKLEKQLNDIKQQNNELNEKLKENEIKLNENETQLTYLHEQAIQTMKDINKEQKQEIAKLKDEINENDLQYNSKIEQQQIELLELKDEINKQQNERTNMINESILKNKQDMEKSNCEIILLKEQLQDSINNGNKYKQETQRLTSQNCKLNEQLNQNVTNHQQKQQQIAKLKHEINQNDTEYNNKIEQEQIQLLELKDKKMNELILKSKKDMEILNDEIRLLKQDNTQKLQYEKQAFEMQINFEKLKVLNNKHRNKNNIDIEALKKRIDELIQLLNKKTKQLSDGRKREKALLQQLATRENIFKIQLKELGQFTKKIKRREQDRDNNNNNKKDAYEIKQELKEMSENDVDDNDKILQYLCSLSKLKLNDDEEEQKILDEIESDQNIVKEIQKFSSDISPIIDSTIFNQQELETIETKMYGQIINFPKNSQKKCWIYNANNDWMYPFNPLDNYKYRIGNVVCFNIYNQNGKDWANNILISEKYDKSVWNMLYDEQNKCKHDNPRKLLIKDASIDLNPNLNCEFKQFKPVNGHCDLNKICEVMLQYLNAFVNTKGGVIYFGIDSDGIIHGEEYIDNKSMDNIEKYIDNRLREWSPKNKYLNLKQQINIQFIKVIHRKGNKFGYLIPNVCVIKASINAIKLINNKKFKNHENKAFIKDLTSIERVKSTSDHIIEIKKKLKEITGNDVDKSVINDIWIANNCNNKITLQQLCSLFGYNDNKEQKQETKCDDTKQSETASIWQCSKCLSSNQLTFQFCTECGHAQNIKNKKQEANVTQILLKKVGNISDDSYVPNEERRTGWIVKNIANKNININAKLIKISSESDVVVKYDKEIQIKMKPNDKMYIFVDVKAPLIPKQYEGAQYDVFYELVLVDDNKRIICDRLQLTVLVKTEFNEKKENKIKLISEMGFNDRKKIISALKKWKWDEASAIDWLATH